MAPPRRYNLNNSSRPSSGSTGTSTGGTAPSPAPAAGGSPSGGGGSSGKNSVNIPAWIMPIGIAYLIIRGLFIIGRNYITIFDWVIIAILAFFAICSFWNGKNRWLSLVLIVAIGCIIWFNQYHIDSFKTQSTPPTEQGQVAPAPIPLEEEIDKRPIFPTTNSPIYLIRSGRYKVKPGKYRLYFSWLGYDTGYVNQWLKIDGLDYKATGRKVYELNVTKDEIQVQFINPYQTDPQEDTYLVIRKEPGGQGLHPFLEPVQ